MGDSRITLTRSQMLKVLRDHDFIKTHVANALCVGETSVRRACHRLKIDIPTEKAAAKVDTEVLSFASKPSFATHPVTDATFVVFPDLHSYEIIWEYFKVVCQFVQDFNPAYLLQIGDLLELFCLMRKYKQQYPSFDGNDFAELDRDFDTGAQLITAMNQSVSSKCKKIYLYGNHEWRATDMIKKHPEFENFLNPMRRLSGLKDWEVHPYLEQVKLGKLNFIHGERYGKHPVSAHLELYHKNVLFGHTHAIEQKTKPSPMREVPIWGATCGCLCSVNADFMRGKATRAEHGFAYGWFDKASGDFDCRVVRVIHGGFWAEGKRYKA